MKNEKRKMVLWTITLTLTSGEEYQFYVKAQTQIDAMVKAEGYKFLADIPRLRKKFCYRD